MSSYSNLAYISRQHEDDAGRDSSEGIVSTDVRGWLAIEQEPEAMFLDPESLGTIDLDGREVVPLTEIWLAAEMPGRVSELLFHFVGDDGFDTREAEIHGIPAMLMEHAFVDAKTHDLEWTIDVPPEFAVKRLVAITVQHASEVPVTEIAID